jgi:hypothetical protein
VYYEYKVMGRAKPRRTNLLGEGGAERTSGLAQTLLKSVCEKGAGLNGLSNKRGTHNSAGTKETT